MSRTIKWTVSCVFALLAMVGMVEVETGPVLEEKVQQLVDMSDKDTIIRLIP
jgi:hypothetical protein